MSKICCGTLPPSHNFNPVRDWHVSLDNFVLLLSDRTVSLISQNDDRRNDKLNEDQTNHCIDNIQLVNKCWILVVINTNTRPIPRFTGTTRSQHRCSKYQQTNSFFHKFIHSQFFVEIKRELHVPYEHECADHEPS